jgi:hypothetical protein
MLCCVRMTCKHSRGGSVIAGPRLMHGACEGIRMKTPWLQSGAVESTRFAQMVAVPSSYCSTIDNLGCKITVFPSPSPDSRRAAAFLRRSTSHLPKPSSPGSWQAPTSAPHEDTIVLPSNGISRYACNRPPLSCYHARQDVAQKA